MKRLMWMLAGLAMMAGVAWATEPTITHSVTTYSTSKPGDRCIAGHFSLTAVGLMADTDSNCVTIVAPVQTEYRTGGPVYVVVAWDSLAGGTSTTTLELQCYGHMTSTDTPGLNGVISNLISLAPLAGTVDTPFEIPIAATTSGSALARTTILIPDEAMPPYISFSLDKEGAGGHLTAGNIHIYYYSYRK